MKVSKADWIFPLSESFSYDKDALLEGMRSSIFTNILLKTSDTQVYDLLVVGQTEAGNIQLVCVYKHIPTSTLGHMVTLMAPSLLRWLEDLGHSTNEVPIEGLSE